MTKFNTLKLYAFCIILLTFALPAFANTSKPNIILILADDQGWNGTSAHMHPDREDSRSDYYQTPNIERLARQGMRFSRGYSPSANCAPSRHALLTGTSPAKNRKCDINQGRGPQEHVLWLAARNNADPLTQATTFAELLHNHAGYATAHYGKWHLPGNPGENGFDEHDGSRSNPGNLTDQDPKAIFSVTDRGLAFIQKQTQANKPFYLQLSHFAVHLPIRYRTDTLAKYQTLTKGTRHANSEYAAMTEDLDTGVGMILNELDRLGIADNTYVIYTSDNGGVRGLDNTFTNNDPLNLGKPQVWEGGIRVPFIIRGPDIAANSWCHAPVVGYDLYPTICEWAGILDKVPDEVEGGSLTPTLRSGGQTEILRKHPFLVFHFPHYVLKDGERYTDARPQSAIVVGDLKLVKLYEWERPRIFDLQQDIGERNDLWTTMSAEAEQMHTTLQNYLAQVNAPMPTLNPIPTLTVIEWAATQDITLIPQSPGSSAAESPITPAEPRADFDGNGQIDFPDFIAFAGAFQTADTTFDLNGSGRVDFSDFLIFAQSFGKSLNETEN